MSVDPVTVAGCAVAGARTIIPLGASIARAFPRRWHTMVAFPVWEGASDAAAAANAAARQLAADGYAVRIRTGPRWVRVQVRDLDGDGVGDRAVEP